MRHLPQRFPGHAVRALLPLLLLAGLAGRAHAQILKPWSPPGDSLSPLASGARVRFQRQVGDSVSGGNYEAYSVVGELARQLFAAMGKAHLSQARAVQATLDSLGLDVEVATDPATPQIIFMLVRNPFRASAGAVGYVYWLRGDDLRMQGVSFPPARHIQMRAWFSGRQDYPYETAILFENLHDDLRINLALLRMGSEGFTWVMTQYAGHGPEMEAGAKVAFTDANLDGIPEIVAFQKSDPDSYYVIRSGVLPTTQELLYTERQEGFVLHDVRPVPGPTETLRMFTELLTDRQYERARRLLLKPAKLDSVLKLGWGRHTERGAWTVEYGEQLEPWPEWLEVRVHQDSGIVRWIFHFWIQDGRWVIRDWLAEKEPSRTHDVVPLPDSLKHHAR